MRNAEVVKNSLVTASGLTKKGNKHCNMKE